MTSPSKDVAMVGVHINLFIHHPQVPSDIPDSFAQGVLRHVVRYSCKLFCRTFSLDGIRVDDREQARKGDQLTCVWCRAPWTTNTAPAPKTGIPIAGLDGVERTQLG